VAVVCAQVPEYKDKYVRATLTFSLIALAPEGTILLPALCIGGRDV
jgi:hypothetical protein